MRNDRTKLHETAVARFGTPDVRFDFGFVDHGYQMDVYIGGRFYGVECRDFDGNHSVPKLSKELVIDVRRVCARAIIRVMNRTLEKFRRKH